MPVETHAGLFFAVDRRDCFDFNEVVSQSTIGALGMVFVKFDSIHDRTEKLTNVAVDVEVLSSIAEIGLCKRQQVLKVRNQSWISVRVLQA